MLKRMLHLARLFGFTRNEAIAVLFLGATAVGGALYRLAARPSPPVDPAVAYRVHDSVFAARAALLYQTTNDTIFPSSTDPAKNGPTRWGEKQEPRPVDINTANEGQWTALPGIGPTIAGRIIEYRRRCGAFTSVESIMGVPGIGPKTFERIKPYLRITSTKNTIETLDRKNR
ncbi:MAG: helix-hairpin-helix domain-containing protein [Bacteroidota bacterium]|nr:helix-hairpin-helix domain-containing protein [Bacteroidota bacterium]